MNSQIFRWFVSVFVLACTSTTHAAVVIDQANIIYGGGIASSFLNGPSAQSFQQSAGNIVGAGFLLAGTGTETVTINLYDLLPVPESGAVLLATGSAQAYGESWVDVYWSEVSISPNTTYFLEISGGVLATAADTGNNYERGIYYYGSHIGVPDTDLVFRTYANNVSVPEPGACAIFLAGVGLFGAITRRRK